MINIDHNKPVPNRDLVVEAIQMAIKALKAQEWVSCKEQQPKTNGWYLITMSGEICGQDQPFTGISEFANGKWGIDDDVDETEFTLAWMPSPEPWKGDARE
jgi:hypothetical protein